jgi:hypothetical protein
MLVVARLLEDAKAETGLDDYGNSDFTEGLEVLVKSINAEADLPIEGEAVASAEIVRMLANRLRMQRDIKRHPEILNEEVLPPIFITSLPRTGSTKLHRMLAASGDFNVMKVWQSYNFAPFEADEKRQPDPRIAAAERRLEWMNQKSPLAMNGHPVFAEETEEEAVLLDAGFNSVFNHTSHMHLPTFLEWAIKQDPHRIFVYLRGVLQYAQWQYFRGQKRRWLLKTPALLGLEGALADVFPGTDFIVTLRQPEKIVASACTLFVGYRSFYGGRADASEAGQFVLNGFAQMVKEHLAWREGCPKHKVLDVRFDEIIHNEFVLVSKIYDYLKMPFADTARKGIQAWLEMDEVRRVSPIHYPLSDYGLNVAQVNEWFSGYHSYYANYL